MNVRARGCCRIEEFSNLVPSMTLWPCRIYKPHECGHVPIGGYLPAIAVQISGDEARGVSAPILLERIDLERIQPTVPHEQHSAHTTTESANAVYDDVRELEVTSGGCGIVWPT